MKVRLAVIGFIVFAISGCSVQAIKPSEEAIKGLAGKSITAVHFEKTDFSAMKAGNAMFGAIGGLAAVSSGNALIAEHGVDDPSAAIAKLLSAAVKEKFGASTVSEVAQAISRDVDEPEAVVKATGSTVGYVLDVKSLNWGLIYFPTNWTHYRMLYSVRGRLINAANGDVVAQMPCSFNSDTEETAPDYDQLIADNGALLKKKAADAAVACAKVMVDSL